MWAMLLCEREQVRMRMRISVGVRSSARNTGLLESRGFEVMGREFVSRQDGSVARLHGVFDCSESLL